MIDPVCAFHGKRWSEHAEGQRLYCVVCFTTLKRDTCYVAPDGAIYDLCGTCGPEWRKELMQRSWLRPDTLTPPGGGA